MEMTNIVSLLGGVAMFLFGMSVMGDSLKKVAGSRMEMILYTLAGNPVKGILLGTGVTAVIQSSSATSVMAVGFVNSGMMKVRQAIGIVLGAILGTSVTGWILCLNSLGGSAAGAAAYFSTEILTGVVALIGIALWMFGKKAARKNVGGILLGFAVLMYGMSMMSGSVAPLRTDERFLRLLTGFSNPLLGVLAGMVITAVIQSASAAVGILQALAVTGALTFDMTLPILMGIGIGASVPVLLSALGAGANGKRTAAAYLIIDVLGAVLCGGVFYALNAVFRFGFMSLEMTMVSVAFINSLYRLAVVILLSPCLGILEKIVRALFPDSAEAAAEQADMDRLEPRFLDHPSLAISQCRAVIDAMAEKALESVSGAVAVRRTYNRAQLGRVYELESSLDRYEDKLGTYLFKITSHELDDAQTREVSKYLRVLSDFERMSDHARNVGEAAEEILDKKIAFTPAAERELGVLENAVGEIARITIGAFVDNDRDAALRVDPLEEVIDDLCDELKARHIDRVRRQECSLEHGFVFNDLLTDYERISDHCSNVAIDVLRQNADDLNSHEYEKTLTETPDALYRRYREEYAAAFAL